MITKQLIPTPKHIRSFRDRKHPDSFIANGTFPVLTSDSFTFTENHSYLLTFQSWNNNWRVFVFAQEQIIFTAKFDTYDKANNFRM